MPVARQALHPTGVRKPAALARFRIAAQALCRFSARPVNVVPCSSVGSPSVLEEILNEYISIVTRASKAWIPELIASAGAEVTETYIDFFTVKKGKTPVWSRETPKRCWIQSQGLER